MRRQTGGWLCGLLSLAQPAILVSQATTREAPSAAVCEKGAAALRVRDRGSSWEILPRCGPTGVRALAEGLRAAREQDDTEHLYSLYRVIRTVKAPGVLDAANSISLDERATTAARATALLVLLSQLDTRLSPYLRIPWSELVRKPIGDACPFSPVVGVEYVTQTPLTADAGPRIAATFDLIRKDESENPVLRDLARCMRTLILKEVPLRVDPRSIRLAYICGNRFQVLNAADEWVAVSFEAGHSSDRGDLSVPPHGSVAFTARSAGTMRLYYDGALVSTTANAGVTCPS